MEGLLRCGADGASVNGSCVVGSSKSKRGPVCRSASPSYAKIASLNEILDHDNVMVDVFPAPTCPAGHRLDRLIVVVRTRARTRGRPGRTDRAGHDSATRNVDCVSVVHSATGGIMAPERGP